MRKRVKGGACRRRDANGIAQANICTTRVLYHGYVLVFLRAVKLEG